MRFKTIATGAGIFLSLSCFAQSEMDALRYSQIHFGGTARANSMAGAFGALGGDFSTLSTNPAGIGLYRKSEFTFTPAFFNQVTDASHYGTSVDDNKYNLNFGNAGWVATFNHSGSGWRSTSFGIGYNRLNNFNRRYTIQGTNTESSLLDEFMNDANASGGIDPAFIEEDSQYAFGTNLAWQTYLIDTFGGQTNYVSAIPNYGQLQRNTVTSSGSAGETVFTLGGNYENKLYLGATFGIQSIRYIDESVLQEFVSEDDTMTSLSSFTFREKLNTRGTGYNFKFGMIYRIHDYFRLGAAVHSPTFFDMRDRWSSYMESDFDNGDHYEYDSPEGSYNYTLITPFRAIGSMAVVFGKRGLISADYEFVDYTSARLRGNSYDFITENTNVENMYTATGNIRIGTEWRINPFSVRAGYAYYGSPYGSLVDNDGSRQSYSIGFGIREKGYFIDLGYVLTQSAEKIYIYDPSLVDASDISSDAHKILVTVGFRY